MGVGGRGRNNAWPLDIAKHMCHGINHNFSQFQALSSHSVNQKLKIIFLGFKVIYLRSRKNEPSLFTMQYNWSQCVCVCVCVFCSQQVCSYPWKPQYAWFSFMTFIVIIGCFSFCSQTKWMAKKKSQRNFVCRAFCILFYCNSKTLYKYLANTFNLSSCQKHVQSKKINITLMHTTIFDYFKHFTDCWIN